MNKNGSHLHRTRQTRPKITELNITRLAMYRTNLYIHAQAFSEDGTKVLASASTAEVEVCKELNGNGGNIAVVTLVGRHTAEKVKVAGIETVAFDRSGLRYHGHVKALADAAHEVGLKF